jgi:hypothetical protein
MKIIKLHCTNVAAEEYMMNKAVYINAGHISVYSESENGTTIMLINEEALEVTETPEEITLMIEDQR